MSTPQNRKQGSTELETFTVKENGNAVSLASASTVTWWQREVGATTNKVSGAACIITDAAAGTCTFDPTGAAIGGADAFDTEGDFHVYIKVIWADGDNTRHPDKGFEIYSIDKYFE